MKRLFAAFAPLMKCWRQAANAGADLCRAESEGGVEVIGDHPATCVVTLIRPVLPAYDTAPCLPIEAWIAAWRVAQLPCRERDVAIRQDLTRFRAGLLVLARLALHDDGAIGDTIVRHVRFDEAVTVAHQWFLLRQRGMEHGMTQYAALLGQVRRADVEIEARLALVGIALMHAAQASDDASDGATWEGWS